MKMVFLGPPGAGKGTQAALASQRYGIPHISTGAILREAMAEDTEMGNAARSYIDAGHLVPDDVVIGIVRERLRKADCLKGFLLDGFPRTVGQAEALEDFAAPDVAINVDVAEDILVARIAGRRMCRDCGAVLHDNDLKGASDCPECGGEIYQRTDDDEETVRNRMKVYHKQTKPLIDFYTNRRILRNIDGDRPIDEVFGDITAAIEAAKR